VSTPGSGNARVHGLIALIFASDYPHHEGTDNPIGRFEKTMKTTPKALKQKFYTENFKVLLDKN
jgi:predicted TIM-barrel fold metal-dependent hydrolase